jgi:hypothetical protein
MDDETGLYRGHPLYRVQGDGGLQQRDANEFILNTAGTRYTFTA